MGRASGKEGLDDVSSDVGEPVVAALVAEGEAFVVDTHGMEESGVEVVHVNGIADDIVAEFVGFPVDEAFLEATASHPHGEAAGVVIASEVVLADVALAVGRATEFAAPDDEGFVEEAALLEVGDEGGGSLIGFLAFLAEAAGQTAVVVPVAVAELDEADAAFGEAAGYKALPTEAVG
jgi:hypothetical protein